MNKMPVTDPFIALPQQKQIMSDPVAHYSSLWPDDTDTLSTIKKLWQKCQLLEEQLATMQIKAGVLSRQVGESKRKKQPTDTLLDAMRLVSDERKTLTKQIKQINQDIFSYFTKNLTASVHIGSDMNDDHKINTSTRHYSSSSTNTDDIHISLFDITDSPDEWNHYVSSNSAACIHHRAEWRNIFSKSYGHESLYFCARDTNQNITGVLPLIHMKSRLFGNKLISMPFFQRAGAIANNPLIENKLIQAAVDYGSKLGIDYIEYRDDILREHLPESFATQAHKVNMVLSLPATQDILWQGFTAKLRAQISRPQREQPKVCIGGREYLNDFYAVYSRNMRDLGSPAQSKHFIDNILLSFSENSWLIIIKLNKRPVAAGFLLGFDRTMEIPLASTVRDVNPLSINMLLYWEVLKFAIKQNYSQFDFGRSSKNSGTYKFKKQWGAQPKQLYWHYWLNHLGAPPSLNPSSPKYALIIKVWKRLPMAVANFLGPAIVKNIP